LSINANQISAAIDAEVYPQSVHAADDGRVFFLARAKDGKKLVGCIGEPCLSGAVKSGQVDGKCVCLVEPDHAAAVTIRTALPWTAPRVVGLDTSVGLGDRLGLATPGHVRAVREHGKGLVPFLAQQSIREMTRTDRTPDEVMDAATFGVLQEGYTDGFGSDADHLQKPEDIDVTVRAGFTMFTIDPGLHVVNEADEMEGTALLDAYQKLDFDGLRTTPGELELMYVNRKFKLADHSEMLLDETAFKQAAVKYGNAVAHTAKMYAHLKAVAGREFELEVSVDETESPTSPEEHYFFASELRRLGVQWVSMAPRFVGRFEKGVDYIGDLDEFRASFARHVAVMRTLGPYKISIHSGSDKFSVYPIVAEMTDGLVHLKTAGTSYLEALRAVAKTDSKLFREILDFARERYDTDKATYHVSAEVSKVPPAADVSDEKLADLLDEFNARQVFHCTFGSVLTADGGERFKRGIYKALAADEETHYQLLASHLGRHAQPFAKQ
jgi:hypothetical protein